MIRQSIEQRYLHDPQIRALVDSLESQIEQLNFTPSEIRECAMLAAIHHEYHRTRTFMEKPKPTPFEERFQMLRQEGLTLDESLMSNKKPEINIIFLEGMEELKRAGASEEIKENWKKVFYPSDQPPHQELKT